MTCVVSSTWLPFSTPHEWSPMNPEDNNLMASPYDKAQHGYVSSESESRQPSSTSGKKRASRAGTRSVSTLSATQLERKRANDREAQRAIRQRTKDHIESLERNIHDLRAAHDANEKLVAVTHQRNRELEEENAYLRTKLNEAGYSVPGPPPEGQTTAEHGLLSIHSASPATQASGASIPRPDSTSTPRSTLSLATSQTSGSRQSSWQQGASGYGLTAAGPPPSLTSTSSVPLGPNLSTWRSHDSVQTMHSGSGQSQDGTQTPSHTPYDTPNPNDRGPWPGQPPFQYPEQQANQRLGEPSPQPQQQYTQAPVSGYGAAAPHQQTGYHPPPQTEFQGMAVQSPPEYHVGQQQSFGQPSQYQMTAMHVSAAPGNPDYTAHQSHMQPPPVPAAGYHAPPAEQQYSQPPVHPPMQFRDDQRNRGYSLTHYPPA